MNVYVFVNSNICIHVCWRIRENEFGKRENYLLMTGYINRQIETMVDRHGLDCSFSS